MLLAGLPARPPPPAPSCLSTCFFANPRACPLPPAPPFSCTHTGCGRAGAGLGQGWGGVWQEWGRAGGGVGERVHAPSQPASHAPTHLRVPTGARTPTLTHAHTHERMHARTHAVTHTHAHTPRVRAAQVFHRSRAENDQPKGEVWRRGGKERRNDTKQEERRRVALSMLPEPSPLAPLSTM